MIKYNLLSSFCSQWMLHTTYCYIYYVYTWIIIKSFVVPNVQKFTNGYLLLLKSSRLVNRLHFPMSTVSSQDIKLPSLGVFTGSYTVTTMSMLINWIVSRDTMKIWKGDTREVALTFNHLNTRFIVEIDTRYIFITNR